MENKGGICYVSERVFKPQTITLLVFRERNCSKQTHGKGARNYRLSPLKKMVHWEWE
jgi:hypothetical protein